MSFSTIRLSACAARANSIRAAHRALGSAAWFALSLAFVGAVVFLAADPALAQVVGGNGVNGTAPNGGSGGTTGDGSIISSTGTTSAGAGGNGGGFPTAGTGASPGNDSLSGSPAGGGGAESGGGGGVNNGVINNGGGGGGGGARAATIATVNPTLTQTYVGGNGGAGADGIVPVAGRALGGGGGGGGYGVVFGGTGTLTINAGANITGGNGGTGGTGASSATNTSNGGGGAGGDGLLVTSAGTTVVVNAAVSGGNGGGVSPVVVGAQAPVGAGGSGIVGAGITLINSGSISGGTSGSGVRANSITFTGGSNSLTFSNATSGLNGDINLATSGTSLTLQQTVTSTLNQAITGSGTVSKTGTGVLTLSGSNTYSGATTVNSGTLSVNGSITSAVTVNNGGTLGGTGTVGATTIANGGSLGPGNSIGTLNVNGNLNFNAGSTYVVEVDPANADRTNATGSANLTGGTVSALFAAGVYTARTYTIISAAGGLGGTTFAGLTNTNLPAGFISSLSYTTTDVILNLTAVLGTTTPGLNPNQQGITTALNTAFNAGGLPGAFIPLFGLTGAQLAAALDQLSPQIYGASEIAALFASQQFTTDLMSCRTPGDGAASIIREGQCLWVKGRERVLDVDQTGNDLGLRDRTASVSAGLQVSLGGNWSGGLALGYDDTETNSGNAKAEGERFNAGAALKYTAGPLQLAAAISGGWGNADVERFISVPGLAGRITGTSDVDAYTAMLRAAYVIEMSGFYLKPLADLSVTRLSLDGRTETGGAAALALQGSDETVVTISPALEVGSNERADWIMPGAWFRPYARAGFSWRDEDRFDVTASFLAVPQPFNTTMELDRITADVAAGFDVIGANGSALKVEYSGRYASDLSDSSISVKGSLPF